ncbi:Ig-like domain repeat protein [Archangium gephyra]|nr:Ig-like domain repeat protein [Archangium gephyra]
MSARLQQPKPPERAPTVRAWREAPSEDSALLLARAYFPEFSGDVEPEARKAPVHPAAALRVRLANRENGEWELATRGHVFRVRPLGDSAAAASRQAPGTTFYGPRHFWKAVGGQAVGQEGPWLTQRVEEYVVTEAGAGTYRASYEVEVPEGIHTVRDAGEYLEFLDSGEVPVVRMHYPVARDEAGHGRQGKVRLRGATPRGSGGPGNLPRLALERRTLKVELEVGLEGLEGLVVVDPGWSSTSSMATARYGHTSTLLLNGKVLAAGGTGAGSSSSPPVSSAELYDPLTGTWSATGSLPAPLIDHTATLLLDGKVLVAGGNSSTSYYLANAQLYDPATGAWSATGSLKTGRHWHTATLLHNGKVLVAGGSGASGGYLTSAELYDPATGTWSTTGPSTQGSVWHTATLLPNGKVLVAGGFRVSRAELYDPTTGTWSATSPLGSWLYWHTATLLATGKVLVAGGSDDSKSVASALLYDPATGTWSGTGAPAYPRDSHSATLLPDGKVLVVSGADSTSYTFWLVNSELYDPATGTWSTTNAMGRLRYRHAATLLPNGSVLVSGGINSGPIADTELYSLPTGSWRTTGPLTTARTGHTTTLLPSGKVLVAGGQNASGLTSSAELYDPAAGTWSATGTLAAARSHHAATLLPAGKVLVTGGDGTSGPLTSAELYDPVAGSWSTTGALATARSWHTATLLTGGKVLVTGGSGTSGPLLSAELYTPTAGIWSGTGSLTTARAHHMATLLPSGKVLVTGGQSSSETLGSSELYEPSEGTFRMTGTLTAARADHTATLLPSGKVLLAGGSGASGPQASTELYDPATGAFSGAAPLTTARSRHVAIPLPSGNVLVAAGLGTTGRLASAEVYDPLVGTFSAVGSLATARADASVTPLPRGKVLVTGGSVATGALASAEVYEEASAPDAWRPLVTPPSPLLVGKSLTVSGSGFRGLSETGGTSNSSATNYPLVSLTAVEGGRRTQVGVQGFSNTSAVVRVPSVRDGYYLLNVTTHAISGGAVVFVDGPPPAPVLTAPAALVNTSTPTLAGTAEPGSTVTVSLDGTPVGTATTDALGLWSLVVGSPLYEGPYTATAISVDGAGNTSPASEPRGFTVDTTAPAVPFLTAPAAFVNATRPTLSGFAEPGITVTVKVDGTPAGTVTADFSGNWSLISTLTLAEGVHTATATTTDVAGNTSESSTARTFTVDTVAPPVPTLTAPAALVTTTTTPVFSGTAEANSTVAVRVDGSLVGTVTAEASGNWSLTPASSLTQGAHTATATATDTAGNTSLPSASRGFTVDTLAPAPPVFSAPAAFVNTTTPPLSGTAEAGSTVEVVVDGSSVGTVTANGSGNWSLTLTSPLAQGAHTATATATDAAGHTSSASAPRGFTVDTVAPAAPVLTAPAALVATARPVISGTAEANGSVTVKVDGTTLGTVTADASGNWSLTPTSSLSQGAHTATATTTDRAGNISGPSTARTFTVDTLAPAAPVLTAPAALVATPTPVFSGTAEAGSTVAVRVDGTLVGTVTAEASGNWSFTPASPLGQGAHTATATASDAAGNTSLPSASRGFTVDTGAPAAPVLTAPASFVNTMTPTLSGTAEAGSTVAVKVDGTTLGTVTANGSGNWSFTPASPLGEGAHTATATATDAAGNTSSPSSARTFTVDTVAPTAPVLTAPAASVTTPTPIISGTAEPGSTVVVKVDGTLVGTATADGSGNWSRPLTSPLGQGAHTATATATDAAGNTSVASTARTFTVGTGDTVPPAAPVLTAPAALVTTSMLVISGTAEAGGTVEVKVDGVSVGTVPVNDSGVWSLTAALGEGAHTAIATVTDRAGNTSVASTARTFTVDTLAPVAPEVVTPAEGTAVQPSGLVFSGSAEAGSTVTVSVDGLQVGKTTADPAGQWSVKPVYALAQGPHTVTATATDAAGHTSPASSGRSFTVEQETQGCGCASSPAGGMASPLGLLALGFWVRRRRLLASL